ncbi:MAG: hypothetical protein DRJ98_00655 [Thermoprotei archaeon]|nr:MAG: hypothetical protein DRJ98_00655 [Thermoprotei archaeon]RLF18582.1 MAG: hypothetical protein DRN06_01165 [Thermoprotei archaeon]
MSKIQRHYLSKRDVKGLVEKASRLYPSLEDRLREKVRSVWELVKVKEINIYFVDGLPLLLEVEDRLIPSIHLAEAAPFPKVVVDMGAAPRILRGADVMAPGIRQVPDSMNPGDVVAIAEEKLGKVLAIGVALMSGREVMEVRRGKALKVLHRVGDEIWKLTR